METISATMQRSQAGGLLAHLKRVRGCASGRVIKTISVSELHEHTANWVQAVRAGAVLIADGGSPVARLEPWPAGADTRCASGSCGPE